MSTPFPSAKDIERRWWTVDADGMVLGRLASQVARLLMGKHKASYTPFLDCGDHVIVVNAAKIVLTGNKAEDKKYHRYSGYPGGMKDTTAGRLLEQKPERVIELAVKGMLPKNRIGRQMYRKLRVYGGDEHPHEAQQPQTYES